MKGEMTKAIPIIFEIPVNLIISSAYSKTKKLKANTMYLLYIFFFLALFLTNKKEHNRDIIGI